MEVEVTNENLEKDIEIEKSDSIEEIIEVFVPDKPFKSYQEQIEHLQNVHKLIINDVDRAIKILKTVSYYDLINGYKEHFIIDEEFNKEVDIDFIYLYSLFDKSFQNIIFKYSILIERKFKNSLAYVLAKNYGERVENYLSKNIFIKNTDKQEKINELLNSINERLESDFLEQPSKHYRDNKNCIPPWILFKNITFNDCIDIYSLMTSNLKKQVFLEMISNFQPDEINLENFKNSLTMIRKFRNTIAHNYKFITYNTGKCKINLLPLRKKYKNSLIFNDDIKKSSFKNDRFGVLMSIIYLLEDDDLLFQFYVDIVSTFTPYEIDEIGKKVIDEYLKNTNLPSNLKSRFSKLFFKNSSTEDTIKDTQKI